MFATMNNLIQFGFLTGLVIILALFADYFIAPALMVIVNKDRSKLKAES
jgi:predicted RND superfamily exporter protein